MSTVTSIVTEMANAITSKLSDVDASSIDGWVPAQMTEKVALIAPPVSQRDRLEWADLSAGTLRSSPLTVVLELWVRMVQGEEAACMQRAREVGRDAAIAIAAIDGTAFELESETPFQIEHESAPVAVGSTTFLPIRLIVSVYDDLTVSE